MLFETPRRSLVDVQRSQMMARSRELTGDHRGII